MASAAIPPHTYMEAKPEPKRIPAKMRRELVPLVPDSVFEWAEFRVGRSAESLDMTELELMRKYATHEHFWTGISHPAIVAFVMCLRDEDELSDVCNLCDAFNRCRPAPDSAFPLPAFEFKLWATRWVWTVGSDLNQVEFYDMVSACYDNNIIAFKPEERSNVEYLIRSICDHPRNLVWEMGTPIFEASTTHEGAPTKDYETWYTLISSFGYSRKRYRK